MDSQTQERPGRNPALTTLVRLLAMLLAAAVFSSIAQAQETEENVSGGHDRESMAMDSTATQWSFQFAYQWMPDYHDDMLDDGSTRPPGLDNYAQLRIVAPVPTTSFTILPRLTVRHYENAQGESGFGNTELFALIVPRSWDWGAGRAGIGPLVTLPGDAKVARDEWGYGFAAAAVNTSGKWFYGLLFTQSWRAIEPNQQQTTEQSDTNPLGIAPFLAYRFGGGWYAQTADLGAQYDGDSGKFYLPIGLRLGRVLVGEKASLNVYAEYRTSLIYDSWPGSAVKNSYRLNVSYTIPVGI
jgi:hypothetical protein